MTRLVMGPKLLISILGPILVGIILLLTHSPASAPSMSPTALAGHVTSASHDVPAPKFLGTALVNLPSHPHHKTLPPLAPASNRSSGHSKSGLISHGAKHPYVPVARHAKLAAPTKPYALYDSTTPEAIPAKAPAAVYATGPYAASSAAIAGHPHLWIDTQGGDPKANALDVEPGDATPAQAGVWAHQRLEHGKHLYARIYTTIGLWPQAKAAVALLPHSEQARVKWWIADPTGVPHIVPGSQATQYFWGHGFDKSLALPGFGLGR